MTDRGCALHELGLAAVARAIRDGDVSSEVYVSTLLQRARAYADLNAFITIDEASVLEAASDADRGRLAGRVAPLLGVPLAIKDSYLTKGLTTTVGTSVLATFTPTPDAAAVSAVKDAGAMVFGKNNLVEMSYGLTGLNEHYGQVKNPNNRDHTSTQPAGRMIRVHRLRARGSLVVHFTNTLTFSACTEIENMRPCAPDRPRRTDASNQSLSDRPLPRGSTGADAASRRLHATPFSGRPRQDDPLSGRRLVQ